MENKIKLVHYATGVLAFFLSINVAQAQLLDISFHNITFNGTENIADQLTSTVRDKNQALMDFSGFTSTDNVAMIEAMSGDDVLFTFSNNVGIASNISEIYFDGNSIFSQKNIINSLAGYTNFSDGGKNGINPGSLPGGETISNEFEANADFGADTQGAPDNGINSSSDIVGIVIKLQSGVDFTQLQQSLSDGALRLGLHVRSIGMTGFSDSFVNNPASSAFVVPIPAATWLFGSALFALAGIIRKKPV